MEIHRVISQHLCARWGKPAKRNHARHWCLTVQGLDVHIALDDATRNSYTSVWLFDPHQQTPEAAMEYRVHRLDDVNRVFNELAERLGESCRYPRKDRRYARTPHRLDSPPDPRGSSRVAWRARFEKDDRMISRLRASAGALAVVATISTVMMIGGCAESAQRQWAQMDPLIAPAGDGAPLVGPDAFELQGKVWSICDVRTIDSSTFMTLPSRGSWPWRVWHTPQTALQADDTPWAAP